MQYHFALHPPFKAESDFKKPVILVMAPTANAAFLIGGRTIDSALGFVPMESNRYIQAEPERLAKMKFLYEDVWVLFIDEISMVGSKKLTKINFRLQDLADGDKNFCSWVEDPWLLQVINSIVLYSTTLKINTEVHKNIWALTCE